MTDAHLRCSFFNANSSLVPDTLIYLLLNFYNGYSPWSPRTQISNNTHPPSFESFHIFINFPPYHSSCHIKLSLFRNFHQFSHSLILGSHTIVLLWYILSMLEPCYISNSIMTTQQIIKDCNHLKLWAYLNVCVCFSFINWAWSERVCRGPQFFCGVWNKKSEQKAVSATVNQAKTGPAGRSRSWGWWLPDIKFITQDDVTCIVFNQYECLHSM
jgi:hypothetical protein